MRLPEALHTVGVVDAKATGSPELAVAAITNGDVPRIWLGIAGKAMVCDAAEEIVGIASRRHRIRDNFVMLPGAPATTVS